MECQLYRHFDEAGALLYVGISLSAISRLAAHNQDAAWADRIARVTIERFASREDAEKAEVRAIREEKPIYNIMHSGKKCEAKAQRARSGKNIVGFRFPGLVSERMASGELRYRVRVDGLKAKRITIPVGPDHEDFGHHYHAARAGKQWPEPTDKPKKWRG